MKKYVFLICLILFSICIHAASSLNYLSKGLADTLYCPLGTCSGGGSSNFTIGNNTDINLTARQAGTPGSQINYNTYLGLLRASIYYETAIPETQFNGFFINSSGHIHLISNNGNGNIYLDGFVNFPDNKSILWGDGFVIGAGDVRTYFNSSSNELVTSQINPTIGIGYTFGSIDYPRALFINGTDGTTKANISGYYTKEETNNTIDAKLADIPTSNIVSYCITDNAGLPLNAYLTVSGNVEMSANSGVPNIVNGNIINVSTTYNAKGASADNIEFRINDVFQGNITLDSSSFITWGAQYLPYSINAGDQVMLYHPNAATAGYSDFTICWWVQT